MPPSGLRALRLRIGLGLHHSLLTKPAGTWYSLRRRNGGPDMDDRTILDLYRHEVDAPRPKHYTHVYPGGQRSLSTEEFFLRTSALAEALDKLGVGRGDRVMLLSENRPEWHMVDLAVLDLGALDVPIYGTLTPQQIAYQANDSGAKVAVVENAEQMAKFLAIQGDSGRHLIQIEGECAAGVQSLDELISSGDVGGAGDRFWDRAKTLDERDGMTIIYTSGTTGDPKGVLLSHENLVQNLLAAAYRIPVGRDDMALEFLPLCHVLERMVGYIYMWRATSKSYCSVYHVGDLMAEVAPTLFVGVPRFYEKVQQKILDNVATMPAFRRGIFNWALRIGREASHHRLAGKKMGRGLAARFQIADRLALSKVRQKLGGQIRYCLSGGAELPLHVGDFFHALGVYVVEGYGLTETSPVIAVNGANPGELRLGTVGKPLRNLAIRLAEDGELEVKGPNVMKGYWNKPEHTAAVFTEDGFFRTGDVAELDDDGFLLIVDRKKDIIVTAGGKNIAPQPVESQLKGSPLVDAAVLIGDRRPFIVALISPSFEDLERWAAEQGVKYDDHNQLTAHPKTQELFAEVVAAVNASLARFEQIKAFRLLPMTLSIEGGQLTPTLKVKRRVVEQQHTDLIAEMYGEGG